MRPKAIITFTTDFGVWTQGIGVMEAVIYSINPAVQVIHLAHGLPSFQLLSAARTLESLQSMPIGFHVCVVDPGVGTKRKVLAIKVKRGDYLIGPDNGVLLPVTSMLGGIEQIVEATNRQFMREPISSVFHGRDIFAPVAAHLSLGVSIGELGNTLSRDDISSAPYEDATIDRDVWKAKVIHINKYGNCHLNITQTQWNAFIANKEVVLGVQFKKDKTIRTLYADTFGDVNKGEAVIFQDEYSRMTIASNLSHFAEENEISLGDECMIWRG